MANDAARAGIDPALIDQAKLTEWLQRSDAPGSGGVSSISQLHGGLQNAVFLLTRISGDTMVLRRPPKRIRDDHNASILREARVLGAIEDSAVPHPTLYDVCDDESVLGANFYLMEALVGKAPQGDLTGAYAENSKWRAAMGPELIKAAAALAAVDYKAVGLEDFGKPDDWHQRQVKRWADQLAGYASFEGYDPTCLTGHDTVGAWLAANMPNDRRIGIVHGDLQFPNVMFSLRSPVISGVVDWELASIGDPMLDLGWILTSWLEPSDPKGKNPMVKPWDDFVSRDTLINQYIELTGRDAAAVKWFFVLACYKLSCLLERTHAMSKAGKIPENIGASVHNYSSWLANKALHLIGA